MLLECQMKDNSIYDKMQYFITQECCHRSAQTCFSYFPLISPFFTPAPKIACCLVQYQIGCLFSVLGPTCSFLYTLFLQHALTLHWFLLSVHPPLACQSISTISLVFYVMEFSGCLFFFILKGEEMNTRWKVVLIIVAEFQVSLSSPVQYE